VLKASWRLLTDTVRSFVDRRLKPWRVHGVLRRDLSRAYSLIVVAIAGLFFGRDAAQLVNLRY
jgi:hypothetical protein